MNPKDKPRIWQWNPAYMPGHWQCKGRNNSGFGRSPVEAYNDWHRPFFQKTFKLGRTKEEFDEMMEPFKSKEEIIPMKGSKFVDRWYKFLTSLH